MRYNYSSIVIKRSLLLDSRTPFIFLVTITVDSMLEKSIFSLALLQTDPRTVKCRDNWHPKTLRCSNAQKHQSTRNAQQRKTNLPKVGGKRIRPRRYGAFACYVSKRTLVMFSMMLMMLCGVLGDDGVSTGHAMTGGYVEIPCCSHQFRRKGRFQNCSWPFS